MINRKRSRAAVNRSQAGIRSRPRRLGRFYARVSVDPLHESSSDAQSAKSGISPTAAHGLSADRFLKEWVCQFSQKTSSSTRPRLLSISFPTTYPQRTGQDLVPAFGALTGPSLSLGALGDSTRAT